MRTNTKEKWELRVTSPRWWGFKSHRSISTLFSQHSVTPEASSVLICAHPRGAEESVQLFLTKKCSTISLKKMESRENSPSKSILIKLDDLLLSQTAERRKKEESRETSPFAAEIGDPAQFLNNLRGSGAANNKKKRDLRETSPSSELKTFPI
jgi:hypothetical protein